MNYSADMESSVYEIVTEKILASLAKGVVPWRKPWSATYAGEATLPRNAVSNRPYSGINFLLLSMAPYTEQRWLTYGQAQDLGGHVNAGEKSTLITFWKITEAEDAEGQPKTNFLLRYYQVFNVEQCSGLTKLKTIRPPDKAFDPIQEAETIFDQMPHRPALDHKGGDRAYYIPSQDVVHLPIREAFKKGSDFYSTLFHELGHSTGHKSRLDRFSEKEAAPAVFGSPVYSREELVAEFCSAYICATAGIDSTIENSAAYIKSWMRVLKDDPKMAVTAAGRGQRAADYILGNLSAEEEKEPTTAMVVQAAQEHGITEEGLMAHLGPEAWSYLHSWANAFKKASPADCGCGDFAVAAMRGLHDAVSLELGKLAQYPEDLDRLAQFLQEVIRKRDILGDPDLFDDDEEDEEEDMAQLPSDLKGLVEEITPEEALGEGIDDDEIKLAPSSARMAQEWRAAMETKRKYRWRSDSGGIIITRLSDAETVFIQPGDDASQFLDEIDNTNDKWQDDDVMDQYFNA